jgi:hypothetical protein
MNPNKRSERGVILVTSYLVITVLLIFSLIFVGRSVNEKNFATREKNLAAAFYLAESGLDRGLVWLRGQGSPPSGTAAFDPLGGVQFLGEGNYSISIDPDDSNPGISLKRYQIISTGNVEGASRQLINEVRVDSYARFAYFTDTEHFSIGWWNVAVWFVGGDTLQGPTHTNSHFHIKGDPVFTDVVGSSDNFITFYNDGNYIYTSSPSNPPDDEPDFQQGIDLGAEPINMPSQALDLRLAASSGGISLTGATTVLLNADGTMNVTNANQGWTDQNMALPANGAFFVDNGNIYVSGTLNGQLTMGSSQDVVITNNLIYADDPIINPSSNDILGLIGEDDVVISQSAPYDIQVYASIMALEDSFMVENWDVGPAKGTLQVYGGIIQDERGPVGTFSGATGQKLSGYSKNYIYDPRLINTPPPFYPTTGDYISLSWKER